MACIRKRRGKWVVDYRDGAGVRYWKTCETKREAEDFLSKKLPETRQWTQPAVDPRMTLDAYANRWLEQTASILKPRTHLRYTQLLKVHVLPAFGSLPVQQLHRGRIKDFLGGKLTELKPARRPDQQIEERETFARNTVRNIHATLRTLLKAAVDDGMLLVNPAEKLGRQLRLVTSKATRQEEIKAMTRDERHAFLTAAAEEVPRYYPLFLTLAGTGMRLGEGLALQWGDLDILSRELRITRALSLGQIDTPKSGHGRTVDLSHTVAATLDGLQQARHEEAVNRKWASLPPWLFCTVEGTVLDEANVRKTMRRVLKKAGLPEHFTPHCLRHTYASLMLQQGESVAYVQRQLGHASIQLTVDTYGKWLPMGNKAAVDRLDQGLTVTSGSKMVANQGGESRKLWSWREELNLQPAVYKLPRIPRHYSRSRT